MLPRAKSASMNLKRPGYGVVSMAPAATKGSVDAQGPCCPHGCAELGGLCFYRGCGGFWDRAAVEGLVWVFSPTVPGVSGDVHGTYSHWGHWSHAVPS